MYVGFVSTDVQSPINYSNSVPISVVTFLACSIVSVHDVTLHAHNHSGRRLSIVHDPKSNNYCCNVTPSRVTNTDGATFALPLLTHNIKSHCSYVLYFQPLDQASPGKVTLMSEVTLVGCHNTLV